ncbi:hypothetical protein ACW7BJ_33220 [Azospirillum argentinense]
MASVPPKGSPSRYGFLPLSQACELAGVPDRTLKFWEQSAVIHCDPSTDKGGRGTKKLFDAREVAVSAIIGRIFTSSKLPYSELIEIAGSIREIYQLGAGEEGGSGTSKNDKSAFFYQAFDPKRWSSASGEIAALITKRDEAGWEADFLPFNSLMSNPSFADKLMNPKSVTSVFVVNASEAMRGIAGA